MAVKIAADQIRNLQQMEVVVSGPDEANRLIIIDGQFDTRNITADSVNRTNKQTFSVLLGPKLTNRQFLRAIATASFARTETSGHTMCNIWDVDKRRYLTGGLLCGGFGGKWSVSGTH